MALAAELLEQGDKSVVLQYLDLVGSFWRDPKLQEWRAQVKAGSTPNFGANLYY